MLEAWCCAGDFDATEMKSLIEQSLGRWRVATSQPATPPRVPNPPLPPQATAGQVRRFRIGPSWLSSTAVFVVQLPSVRLRMYRQGFKSELESVLLDPSPCTAGLLRSTTCSDPAS